MMAGTTRRYAEAALGLVRILAAILLAILLVMATYVAAGLAGGAIAANPKREPPASGVRIFVENNGIHTDIVVPKRAAGVDWRGLMRPGDIADPRYAGFDHLAIGWGERAFYIGTPTWSDLDFGTLVHAATGSDDTVLHVEHVPAPTPGSDVRPVILTVEEYRRLAAFIRSNFAPGAPRSVRGYGPNDAFYAARGHYDVLNTCNVWTGRALRFAGVRMGVWTPFSDSVMLSLRASDVR